MTFKAVQPATAILSPTAFLSSSRHFYCRWPPLPRAPETSLHSTTQLLTPKSRRGACGRLRPERFSAASRNQSTVIHMQMKTPPLDEVLQYSNRDVVYRFKKTYGITCEESEDIFEQVKK